MTSRGNDTTVAPTSYSCRALAAVFGIPAIEVMQKAGLVRESDMNYTEPSAGEEQQPTD